MILGLVYGYIPFMILPLFGSLDRINQSLLEAGRDLGASPLQTFRRVTLPLSKPAILAGLVIVSLPMFGDYYTNDLLGTTTTSMFGNLIDNAVGQSGQGPEAGSLTLILMVIVMLPMLYYLRATKRAAEGRHERRRRTPLVRHPGLGDMPAATAASRGWLQQPVAQATVPPGHHVGLPALVDPARRDRRDLLVQRRAFAQHVAGVLDAVVVPGPVRLALPRSRRSARR